MVRQRTGEIDVSNDGGRRGVRSRRLTYSPVVAVLAAVEMGLSAQPAIAAAGELDLSFGTAGVLSATCVGTCVWAYAAAVRPDGDIVAAGVSNGARTYHFALTRYRPGGSRH